MADAVAGGEGPDLAGFNPLAEPGRDVIAERVLGAQRLRHQPKRRQIGINRDGSRNRLARLAQYQARAVPQPQIKFAELEPAARRAQDLKAPARLSTRGDAEDDAVLAGLDLEQWRQRHQDLDRR